MKTWSILLGGSFDGMRFNSTSFKEVLEMALPDVEVVNNISFIGKCYTSTMELRYEYYRRGQVATVEDDTFIVYVYDSTPIEDK